MRDGLHLEPAGPLGDKGIEIAGPAVVIGKPQTMFIAVMLEEKFLHTFLHHIEPLFNRSCARNGSAFCESSFHPRFAHELPFLVRKWHVTLYRIADQFHQARR